jgi:hypothetical protein
MTLEPGTRVMRERWFEVTSTALGLTIAGAAAWMAAQVVGMRDDVHTVKDQLPAMSQRLDRIESRVDKLDDDAREHPR